ncbi:hypothetical protein V7S43_013723 [Phytophthora oleae]|uniref:Uncharacterized protein n=1 Tax=Phytophthora oleae TaxID=2107226 RepID=A0ABD3F7S6_9STRA
MPNFEAEGVTTFHPPHSTSYRYMLQLQDDKLSSWIEDKISKKQWSKGGMAKDGYITPANSITDASALDYAKFFQDALDRGPNKCGDVQRTVEILQDGALRLSFAVQFSFLRSMRVAKYTFELIPVSVERIDVLESKLRDQQEELERLRKEVSAGHALPFARLETSTKNANTRKLLWKAVESDFFHVVEGEVSIRQPGVYSVAAVMNNSPQSYSPLMKNK